MERDDPFGSLADLCQISSSQQEQLSRCRFAGEPEAESFSGDDSSGIPVESTGILMLSVPDSADVNGNDAGTSRDNDVFHTPPEESSQVVSHEQQWNNVSVDIRDDRAVEGVADNGNLAGVDCKSVDVAIAVDLGRDTDLGFLAEMEVTEKIETDSGSQSSYGTKQLNDNKVIRFESINFTIEEGELNESDGLGETPAKKLKIRDKNLGLNTPTPCLGSEVAQTLERVAKSIEKLTSPSKNSKKLDGDEVLERSRDTSRTKSSSFLHTAKKLSFKGASPQNCFNSLQNQQNKNVDCIEKERDRCVVRKLQFRSAPIESRTEENEGVLVGNKDIVEGYQTKEIEEEPDMEDNKAVSAVPEDKVEAGKENEKIEDGKTDTLCRKSPEVNSHERQQFRVTKSIGDIDKFRYVRPTGPNSSGKGKDFGVKRALPLLSGNNSNAQGEVALNGVSSTSYYEEITVLDVLRELAKDYTWDPALAKLSVLEAAKRGGMTFP